MSELKLYEVELDQSISYWVAARSAAECKSLIHEIDPLDVDDIEEEVDWDIREKDPALLADTLIHDDDSTDSSGKTPLAELFRECETPSVIACSEW
jgi:hypothetical protein